MVERNWLVAGKRMGSWRRDLKRRLTLDMAVAIRHYDYAGEGQLEVTAARIWGL